MLIRPTPPGKGTDPGNGPTRYRSDQELAIRSAVERWGRAKWPAARVVHELVVDRGTVRADMAFVSPAHLVVVEIKSAFDTTVRLIQQVGMFRLVANELWVACALQHLDDVRMVCHLLPSVGQLIAEAQRYGKRGVDLSEIAPASLYDPFAKPMMSLLWVDELKAEAVAARLLTPSARLNHAQLVDRLLTLPKDELLRIVCRRLRQRDAFWKADPPVNDAQA